MLPWFQPGACPLFLAPMARYTDVAFRELCKREGADVMTSEFVRAESLLAGGARAWAAVDFTPAQRPMGVQLFGASPESMATAAQHVVERLAPDFIDINCGCPAPKVVDTAAGSSLLLPANVPTLARVVRTVATAIAPVPVTVKIRLGWDEHQIVADDVGRRVEDAGAQALAIHGRTKVQGYRGEADWDAINRVAAALTIPVIGNGNIRTCEDVMRLRQSSPVRGLMIGRAALGNPWLFREIKGYLATGERPTPPSLAERWETLLNYADQLLAQPGHGPTDGPRDLGWMRAKLKSLTGGLPQARRLRAAFDQVHTRDELLALAHRHQEACAAAESSASAPGDPVAA